MTSIRIQGNTAPYHYTTLDDIRGIPSQFLERGQTCHYTGSESAAADEKLYVWNPTSTSSDDGDDTLKPDDLDVLDAGRWKAVKVSGEKVTFTQSGSGSVTRTMQDKARETVSVLDYSGIDPTGITDCTTAIQAAIDYAGTLAVSGTYTAVEVHFPPGVYKCAELKVDGTRVSLIGHGATLLLSDPDTYILYYAPQAASVSYERNTPNYKVKGLAFESDWMTELVPAKTWNQIFQDECWEIVTAASDVISAAKNVGIIVGHKRALVEDCTFNIGVGVLWYSTATQQTGLGNDSAFGHAIFDGAIRDCTFEICLYGLAFFANSASGFYVGNIVVEKCYWRNKNKCPIIIENGEDIVFRECVLDSHGINVAIDSFRLTSYGTWWEAGITDTPTHLNLGDWGTFLGATYDSVTISPGSGRAIDYNWRFIGSEFHFDRGSNKATFFATDNSSIYSDEGVKNANRTSVDNSSVVRYSRGFDQASPVCQPVVWNSDTSKLQPIADVKMDFYRLIPSDTTRSYACTVPIKRLPRTDKVNLYSRMFGEQLDSVYSSAMDVAQDSSAPLYPKCLSVDLSAGSATAFGNTPTYSGSPLGFVIHFIARPTTLAADFEYSLNHKCALELNKWQQVVAFIPLGATSSGADLRYLVGAGNVARVQNWCVTPVYTSQEIEDVMHSDKYPAGYVYGSEDLGATDPEWITGSHLFAGLGAAVDLQLGRGSFHDEAGTWQQGGTILAGEELDELWVKASGSNITAASLWDRTTASRYAAAAVYTGTWTKVTLSNTTPTGGSNLGVHARVTDTGADFTLTWAYRVKRLTSTAPFASDAV